MYIYILYNNDPSSDFGETLINNYGLSSYHWLNR
jgi:hypothetical protein